MNNLLFEPTGKLLSFKAYQEEDGFNALCCALKMKPEAILEEIKKSQLLGRGGAAFPVWMKMKSVYDMTSDEKYVICNADEGEPGTFKDRELLKRNALKVIESVIIAAYTVGAHKGYLYVRGEYAYLEEEIMEALRELRQYHYLGNNILDSNFSFDIEYRSGIGAYICGEETALIESIEGRSGDPRNKPPYTAQSGLFGKPTLVNNVETLANLLPILNYGSDYYLQFGTEKSKGTKLFSVSGAVNKPGVYEIPFGISLRTLIDDFCGGSTGRIKFVQVGGSAGVVLSAEDLDVELSYEAFKAMDAGLGSGAILVADESVCIVDFLKATSQFFRHESCGKCTPCREGNRHIELILDKFSQGLGKYEDIDVLLRTSFVMKEASFCGLGQTATTALVSSIRHFRDEIHEHIAGQCKTGICKMGGVKDER